MKSFQINLYSGIFFRRDAISNSLLHKYEVVQSLRAQGVAIDCRIFTHGTDHALPETIIVPSAAQATTHPAFRSADLHVYEFGIHYDLFNAILLKAPARKLVFYHNITPPSLVSDEHARQAVKRSQTQINNLSEADEIICISEFSRRELAAQGFESERLSVLHLPSSIQFPDGRGTSEGNGDGLIHLLFVGRFTPAKGLLDLIRAIGILKRKGRSAIRLALVGAMRFSDPTFLEALRSLIAAEDVAGFVNIVGELSEDELAVAYSRADIFTMPSYHEGYCVPLLEAMSAGCFPVVYDAGNLPFLMSGLGSLSPAGDVQTLANRLDDVAQRLLAARQAGIPPVYPTERGDMRELDWQAATQSHVAQYSREAYVHEMSNLFLAEIDGTHQRRSLPANRAA
jgi:glycosyltransferase involved in cell wall biosynthesis